MKFAAFCTILTPSTERTTYFIACKQNIYTSFLVAHNQTRNLTVQDSITKPLGRGGYNLVLLSHFHSSSEKLSGTVISTVGNME